MDTYILTISCPDKRGIVAAISGFLAKKGGFILESSQFGDTSTDRFFMRILFYFENGNNGPETFGKEFAEIGSPYEMEWELHRADEKVRVLLMVSKISHCLNALLNKTAMGELQIEIPAIVSNHPDLQKMADWYGIPFFHYPVEASSKAKQEQQVLDLIAKENVELVVLARYMQILSEDFVSAVEGRIINIHHSFLPSFKGAKPYHQAYEKGVKLIGATAHYVTADLDEGPIIEQEVTRVDHSLSPEELVGAGRDIEAIALSKAVKWHTQRRIFLNGHKTVIFR